MKKKIFAVSDIHGNAKILKNSLLKAGFDENNPNHLLISLGDAFDRGKESLEVYKYLKRLDDEGKAIVLRGNHTKFFVDYLKKISITPFNYLYNGTSATFNDFLHNENSFEDWCFEKGQMPDYDNFASWLYKVSYEINKEFPELLPWLEERPYYLETKNYIFTHGAIDTNVEDWHYPHCYRGNLIDWEALAFDDGGFFGKEINNTDKTVVIGHYGTFQLRKMYGYSPNRNLKGEYDILKRKDGKVIAIDATTNLSKKINVLIIEDEEI